MRVDCRVGVREVERGPIPHQEACGRVVGLGGVLFIDEDAQVPRATLDLDLGPPAPRAMVPIHAPELGVLVGRLLA